MPGADIIRYMCKTKSITQKELADRLGCPLQSLHNKLYRDTFPYKEVEHIADLLGFDIVAIQRQLEQEGQSMKLYTIIGGVNGAGKSSLTGSLKYQRSDLGRIIDVDKLALQYGSNIEGGKAAIAMQERYLQEGISFTQETTLSGKRPLRMVKQAKDAGYYVRLFYVAISSPEEAIERIRNRVAKGGHDIPEEDVRRRFAARFESLARILPYCDEAVFFDNENGFAEVSEYRNGELRCLGDYRPSWLLELRAELEQKLL